VAELAQRAPPHLGNLGYIYAVAGRRDDARKLLHELEEQYSKGQAIGQYLAMVAEGLGERDQAFAWLEKDFQQHSAELQFTTWRVQFEQLRRDPRYGDLMRRMGLRR
jgi:Flp pilus assembly protein TadD